MTTKKTMAQEAIDGAGGLFALAQDLLVVSRDVEDNFIEPGCDEPFINVRLQCHDGWSQLRTGDSQCDQDHRGFWGSSSVGQNLTFDGAVSIAKDLINQVLDHEAQSQS